jgi:4-hydroxybenzoate polyprenyltransferase
MWFLNLIRWKNLLIVALTQVLVFFLICPNEVFLIDGDGYFNLVVLCVSTLTVTAAGNSTNDIYDRKIDSVNKPGSNSVGDKISTSSAWLLASALNLTGVGLGFLIDVRLGITNVVVAILLWLYSYKLKCIPLLGNLVVAVCMGLVVWVVSYANGFCSPLPFSLYVMFSMITGLVREIVKDIEDVEGDNQNNCKTLAVAAGVPFAKNLAAAVQFFGALLIAAGSYYLVRDEAIWHLLYFSAAVVLPMLILFGMIIAAKTKHDYGRISAGLKLIMLTGLLYLPLAHYL